MTIKAQMVCLACVLEFFCSLFYFTLVSLLVLSLKHPSDRIEENSYFSTFRRAGKMNIA